MASKGDVTKIDGSPESTWGASQQVKLAWAKKYGTPVRKSSTEAPAKNTTADVAGEDAGT